MLFICLKMLLSVFVFLLKNIVCGFFNLSESEHIYDTSLYVRANINDIKQHYPDAFYNPAIIRLRVQHHVCIFSLIIYACTNQAGGFLRFYLSYYQ